MAENWIVPCNVKFYDIIGHFKLKKTVVWKNSFTIRKDDIVYLYLASPYGEIKYKCIVIDDNVDEKTLSDNAYAIPEKKSNNYFSKKEKYMQIELIEEFPSGIFTLKTLKEYGLGQVQIQARTDRRLQKFIDEVEADLIKQGIGGDK